MRTIWAWGVATLLVASGCEESLGVCDESAARMPVYDGAGFPAYPGQALAQVSCGNGGFCHASGIPAELRFGAPHHLSFDIGVASFDEAVREPETERLRRGQRRMFDERFEAWEQVTAGTMPPGGEAGDRARSGVPLYRFVAAGTQTPLPAIESKEGREIFRNWLACGTPVVERAAPRADGMPNTIGDTVPRDTSFAVRPNFQSIYERLLDPMCGQSCHNPELPDLYNMSLLDLSTRAVAYANLVGAPAAGRFCGMGGTPRVAAGNPDGSLLIQKLEGSVRAGGALCGDPMPLGLSSLPPDLIEPIRQWIMDGAMNNDDPGE